MKRTTVKLPDDLDARLRHESERRGRTVSDLTRDAIDRYLGGSDGQGKRQLLAAGAGRSGHQDISDRIEEILSKELGASRS
jgi:predicted transcriptional regulator